MDTDVGETLGTLLLADVGGVEDCAVDESVWAGRLRWGIDVDALDEAKPGDG